MSLIEKIHEKLKSAPPDVARQVWALLEALEAGRPQTTPPSSWEAVLAKLPGSPAFEGDPKTLQDRMRAEWEREMVP